MRRIVLASVILGVSVPAYATSPDLIFCSKLPDKTERIHCYDAAARIAEARPNQTTRATMVTQRTSSKPPVASNAYAAALPIEPPSRGKFHGAYAAIGAGYGVHQLSDNAAGTWYPRGWSALPAVGYNLQHGNLVVGAELSGRYGAESASSLDIFSTNAFLGPVGFITDARFKSDSAVHLSGRLGYAINDTMIYMQAGAGATHIKTTTDFTAFGRFCDVFAVQNGQVVCTASSPFTLTPPTSFRTSEWYPSALLGVGIEQNIGWAFARIGAEAEGVLPRSEVIWAMRGKAQVGARF